MRRILLLVLMAAVLMYLIPVGRASAELFGQYVSYKACKECHAEIVEGWLKTPHAKAFDTLRKQGEEKLQNPGCSKCHVVAMDADGGFIDMQLTPELKDVQCESCHGPGLKHSKSKDPKDVVGSPKEDTCRVCHTTTQDKNFDFKKKSVHVHGDHGTKGRP